MLRVRKSRFAFVCAYLCLMPIVTIAMIFFDALFGSGRQFQFCVGVLSISLSVAYWIFDKDNSCGKSLYFLVICWALVSLISFARAFGLVEPGILMR